MAPWEDNLSSLVPRMTVPHEMVGKMRERRHHRKKKIEGCSSSQGTPKAPLPLSTDMLPSKKLKSDKLKSGCKNKYKKQPQIFFLYTVVSAKDFCTKLTYEL